MNSKSPLFSPAIAALTMFAVADLFTSGPASAQSPPSKTPTTWRDLGFSKVPEGFSTDEIPLFEGLNEARGTWSFKGEATDGETATPLEGSLHIMGDAGGGMLPVWKMVWGWPADDPGHAITYIIGAGPQEGGFDLMLTRVGPVKRAGADKAKTRVLPTMFEGTWNLENRIITWTERGLPAGLRDQAAEEESPTPKQTFEMVVAADGKILIQNSMHATPGQMTSGGAIVRTGKAPAEPVTLVGDHRFKTADGVLDRRIKPWLPPQATEISLLSERNGHYARYKVEEDHFMKFLDGLGGADKGSSAHKREKMGGSKDGFPKSIAKRVKTVGK